MSKASSEQPRKRGPRGNKGQKTKALIQETIIYFVSDEGLGLSEITLDRICKKAGVTIGAFYFHFRNKDAAIEETAIDLINDMHERISAIEPADDLYSELNRVIRLYVDMFAENPRSSRLVYIAVRSLPAVHAAYVRSHKATAHRLEESLKRERRAAGRGIDHSYMMVEFLLAGIESFVENVYTWGDAELEKAAGKPEELAHRLAMMWCHAATARLSR